MLTRAGIGPGEHRDVALSLKTTVPLGPVFEDQCAHGIMFRSGALRYYFYSYVVTTYSTACHTAKFRDRLLRHTVTFHFLGTQTG